MKTKVEDPLQEIDWQDSKANQDTEHNLLKINKNVCKIT